MKKSIVKRWAAGVMAGTLMLTALPVTTMASEVTDEQVEEEVLTEESSTQEDTSEQTTEVESEEESTEEELSYFDKIGNDTDTDSETETTEETTETETVTENEVRVFSMTRNAVIASPEVDGQKVTFRYYAPDATSVCLAGEMNSWTKDATPMDKDEETGVWSVTLTLELERYEYKFVVNGADWYCDPCNDAESNGNSLVTIEANHQDEVSYTYTIYYNDTDAYDYHVDDAALWIWTDGVDGVEYDFVEETTLSDGETWLKAEVTLPYDTIYLIPKNNDSWSWQDDTFYYANSTRRKEVSLYLVKGENQVHLTVPGEQTEYAYTIYYYGEDKESNAYGIEDTALWLWTDNVLGSLYYFTKEEELEDGKTWVRADIILPYEKIYMIPRAYESWEWQDVETSYINTDQKSAMTLYLVQGSSTVYTSLPQGDGEETLQRSLIIEYERKDGVYEDKYGKWNIYTWDSGYGNITIDFELIDSESSKRMATIPVTKSIESVSFCMRKSSESNLWVTKDGGDHNVKIPLDQTVVKARFKEDEGVTEILPYNVGYEMDGTTGKIHFYYRDDALFATYDEASLKGKVSLVWDGNTYEMQYDAENERYTYTGELTTGSHYYGYMVKGELITDAFNDEVVEVEGTTYSSYQYKAFDVTAKATLSLKEMNYNDNAVLKVELDGDEQILEQISVAGVTADLSEIGGKEKYSIDPELMEGTIAVTESTAYGKKVIPIAVKDQYGNYYETEVQVEVVPNKDSDFDWEEAVIYFAVTDRFFDGDSSNNGTTVYAADEGSMYHGGDFKGLESKLDYLKDLGVNTVWITPIVSNMEDVLDCDGYQNQHNSAYHGYWADDFTALNSHLGTEEEFSKLIAELHKRDMKLMVDVVLNHAGYDTEDYFNSILDGKKMLRDSSNTVSGDDRKAPLSNLPDFVTEDAEVRELLVEWQSSWIQNYDIDYYRVDTVKHVEDTTWKAFKNALTYINPDFKMIGEYSGAGYATDAGQLRTGQMDALLDFDFNDKALAFAGGDLAKVEQFLESRNAAMDNTATMGSFLGSHDEDGLMYRMMQSTSSEGLGFSEDKAYDLMKVAASLELTAKGQPIVYYGEELGQTGANNWPYQDNRYDYNWSIANDDNEMLVHYKKMLGIRNEYTEVFAKGDRETVKVDNEAGILVASRSYEGKTLYVGLNVNQDKAVEVEISVPKNGNYTDLYLNKVYTAKGNKLTITIPAAEDGGTSVLVVGGISDENQGDEKPIVGPGAAVGATTGVITTPSRRRSSTTAGTRVSATPVIPEPTVRKADGTVLTGWRSIVADAITQTSLSDGSVPLAGDLTAQAAALAAQVLTVDIQIDSNVNKTIPADVVASMAASGMNFRIQIGQDIVIFMTNSEIKNMTGALDLSMGITKTDGFSQGFDLFMMHPNKDNMVNGKVTVQMHIGEENTGKTAYVFCNNQEGTAIGFATNVLVDANGWITIPTVNLTDCVVLYK